MIKRECEEAPSETRLITINSICRSCWKDRQGDQLPHARGQRSVLRSKAVSHRKPRIGVPAGVGQPSGRAVQAGHNFDETTSGRSCLSQLKKALWPRSISAHIRRTSRLFYSISFVRFNAYSPPASVSSFIAFVHVICHVARPIVNTSAFPPCAFFCRTSLVFRYLF